MSSNSSNKNDFISLPKGGGSVSGLGEKFSPDLHTGTGNFSIPISIPKGRNGFQPELNLQYSTGNPNGILGLGWNLSIPNVSRKTSKGIPVYDDCKDTFVLSGFEDLVNVSDTSKKTRFRPRTEGVFAEISFIKNATDSYWEVRNQNGLISIYGNQGQKGNDDAVDYDPEEHSKEFCWHLTQTTDPFGNKIRYSYKSFTNDCSDIEEKYLDKIEYVNYNKPGAGEVFLVSLDFSYEDRTDIISGFKSGFEMRTGKRLKEVIVSSHGDVNINIKKYKFEYYNSSINEISLLSKVQLIGFDNLGAEIIEMAPIELKYSPFNPETLNKLVPLHGDIPFNSLKSPKLDIADINGNGLPDIVEFNQQIRSWKNLGNGRFVSSGIMNDSPSVNLSLREFNLIDANGDGRADIFQLGIQPGYFSLEYNEKWDSHSLNSYSTAPSLNLNDPNTRLFDVTGDGITDIVQTGAAHHYIINNDNNFEAWKNIISKNRINSTDFPDINFSDPRVKLADMSGDGMQDIVFIDGNNISYWPNKGYGNWGKKIDMKGKLNLPDHLELDRFLIGDVDGDGLSDIILIENHQIKLWINKSGKSLSEEIIINGTPPFNNFDDVRIIDLLGTGVSGVLWSSNKRLDIENNFYFLDLTGKVKPYLLCEINNNIGATTRIEYSTSSDEYVEDMNRDFKWKSYLPIPVNIVKKVEINDQVSKSKMVTIYKYHHGHWDGEEREFRGFGMVEQFDSETFSDYNSLSLFLNELNFNNVAQKYFTPPTHTKTWFHLGPVRKTNGNWETVDYSDEYNTNDSNVFDPSEFSSAELAGLMHERHRRDALRAMRGKILRTELYVEDNSALENKPSSVQEFNYGLRIENVTDDPKIAPVIFTFTSEQRNTVWERGDDPLSNYVFTSDYDSFGHPTKSTNVTMPRRFRKRTNTIGKNFNTDLNETRIISLHTKTKYASNLSPNIYIHDRVAEIKTFEFIDPGNLYYETDRDDLKQILIDQTKQAKSIHRTLSNSTNPAEGNLISHTLNFYDGAAFTGLPFDRIGKYGAIVKSETLVFTNSLLTDAYTTGFPIDRRPSYSNLWGGSPTVPGTPALFGSNIGYALQNAAPYAAGYYFKSTLNKYAFQIGGDTRFEGLLVEIKDPLENSTKVDYDKYDLFPVKVTDAAGNVTSADYNYKYFVPSVVTDINGNKSNFEFNSIGLPAKIWKVSADGTEGGTQLKPDLSFSYSLIYNPVLRQPVSVTTEARIENALTPGSSNKKIKTVEYSDGFGRLIQKVSQADDVRFGSLGDDSGLNPVQGSPNSRAIGSRNSSTVHNTIVSGWQTFNNKGLPVEKYEPFYSVGYGFIDDAFFGVHAEIFYDALGREVTIVFPDGTETRTIYGSINDVTNPDNYIPSPWEKYVYDANDLKPTSHQHTPVSYLMDGRGKVLAEVKRNGNVPVNDWFVTNMEYDILGNNTAVIDSKNRRAFEYKYDLLNRVLRIDNIDAGKRTNVYDSVGNIIEYRDDKGGIVLRTYDKLNRLKRVFVRNNSTFPVLRVSEEIIYGDEPGLSIAVTSGNNLKGKIYKYFDESGLTTYHSYDFKDNIESKSRKIPKLPHIGTQIDWGTLIETSLNPFSYQTDFEYDALNRVTKLTYPVDVNGNRTELDAVYNPSGKLRSIDFDGENYVEHISYNAKDQRLLIAYGNGVMTRYCYHAQNFRLERLRTESFTSPSTYEYRGAGGVLQDFAYNYDDVGNILQINHAEPGSGFSHDPDKLKRVFTYDAIYRLESATGRETQQPDGLPEYLGNPKPADHTVAKRYKEQYDYDEMGNFNSLTHNHNGTNYISNFTNEVNTNRLDIVDFPLLPNVKYTYDENGNLTDEGNTRRMSWDQSDRMVKFVIHDGRGNNSVEADYCYDSMGMRVIKKVKRAAADFITIYIDGIYEHSIDLTSGKTNNYFHIMDDKSRIAMRRVGDDLGDTKPPVQYHLGDHLGSSNICIGGADATRRSKVSQEEYSPYGETTFGSHSKKRYRYSGKERDEESGMYYYGARYYLAWVCRWASCDPVDLEKKSVDNEIQNFTNMYSFTLLNPMIYYDPDGEKVFMIFYSSNKKDDAFKLGAQTRMKEIMNSPEFDISNDTIFISEFDHLGEIGEKVREFVNEAEMHNYGKTVEVDFFSHSGLDGPIGRLPVEPSSVRLGQSLSDRAQLKMSEWENINFNWDSNSVAVFYGCQSLNFAKDFLEIQPNLQYVAGYEKSVKAYPSLQKQEWDPAFWLSDNDNIYWVGGKEGNLDKAYLYSTFGTMGAERLTLVSRTTGTVGKYHANIGFYDVPKLKPPELITVE